MPKNSKGKDIAEVISKKCSGCQSCLGECPVEAIDIVDSVAKINPDKCIGCGKCVRVCPSDAILFDKPIKKKTETAQAKPSGIAEYKGVAVFIEVKRGAAADVSWELVGKARELATKLDTQVYGFLLGSKTKSIAQEAISYGCDKVYTLENSLFEVYVSKIYGNALTYLCNQVKPEVFLIGATPLGRDLSSVIATQLQTGLTADCTGLDISEEKLLMMTRPTFGGNIMATILCRNHRPQMSTVRPKVMKMPKKDAGRTGEIIPVKYEVTADALGPRIIKTITLDTTGVVEIIHSKVLVVLGKGACDAKYFPMLEEFSNLIGGTIACSRPLVEAGLLPYARQVGQTGKTVAPKLYVGIGVSGAVQHLVGMQGSEKVIAINADKYAPMAQIADYSIIGDYLKVVPELIKGLKARGSNFKTEGAK